MQVTRVDKPYGDGKYVSFKSLKAAKYNRTVSVIKGTFSFKQDIPDDTLVSTILLLIIILLTRGTACSKHCDIRGVTFKFLECPRKSCI
jgi:hypothetical protein